MQCCCCTLLFKEICYYCVASSGNLTPFFILLGALFYKSVFHHYLQMIASLSVIVTTGKSYAIDSAVKQAHLAGIPVVVAAGNFKRNACLYSPASSPYAISVGESLILKVKAQSFCACKRVTTCTHMNVFCVYHTMIPHEGGGEGRGGEGKVLCIYHGVIVLKTYRAMTLVTLL